MGLTHKLLQYVSYKLISVMKLADDNGLNIVTGEFIPVRPNDEQEVDKLGGSDKK